ncbi:MAG: PHP domain-containing protein [Candidatus Tectomicrobia bacterium]|nr:PHP domain-containing protein [Candidatus Tectomicrobia bacterium]
MKLKLDLQTHCFESMGYAKPTVETVGKIVNMVKARGLDGIAITEHGKNDYGFKAKEIADHYFPHEIILIPGQEVMTSDGQEVVELFLPNGAIFKFLSHPESPFRLYGDLGGIEIDNLMHNQYINKKAVQVAAEKYGLLLLRNSDAHILSHIGTFYNELTLEELMFYAKA